MKYRITYEIEVDDGQVITIRPDDLDHVILNLSGRQRRTDDDPAPDRHNIDVRLNRDDADVLAKAMLEFKHSKESYPQSVQG